MGIDNKNKPTQRRPIVTQTGLQVSVDHWVTVQILVTGPSGRVVKAGVCLSRLEVGGVQLAQGVGQERLTTQPLTRP